MLDNLFHKKHPNVSQKREEENKENILSSVEDAKTNTFMLLAKKEDAEVKRNTMKWKKNHADLFEEKLGEQTRSENKVKAKGQKEVFKT